MVKPLAPRAAAPARLPRAARRRQLLAAVLPELARTGFAGTGTRQLAAAAGVTEPVLYQHFPTKAALFEAVLAAVETRIAAALRAALPSAVTGTARLAALIDAFPGLLLELEDELRVLNGAAAAHADAAQVRAVRRAYRRLASVLAEAFAGLRLRREVDAVAAGLFVLEVGLGSSLLRAARLPEVAAPGRGSVVLGLLLRSLVEGGG